MATKNLGHGAVTTCNAVSVTLVTDATPPGKKRVLIDGSTLTEDLATYEAGIEDFSEYTFNHFWEPGDSVHEGIETLFGAKTEVAFTIAYNDTGVTTETFNGIVSDLEMATIVKDGLLSRKVTVQRTGAISRA
jgi:hypothetical protein